MCGIVGIIKEEGTPVTENEFEDFLDILVEAEVRGRHATGVIYVFEDGKTFCMKAPAKASLASSFIPYRKNVRALLGHTRHSTGGRPEDNENNHPHENSDWALIHNGSCWTTIPDKDLNLKSRCDTEEFIQVFQHMSKEKPDAMMDQVLVESFAEMGGGWSLAFVHKPTSNIYLTTNGRSPLNCVYFPTGMYFASVALYLDKIDRYNTKDLKNGVYLGASIKNQYAFSELGLDTVFEPKENQVYVVTAGGRLKHVCDYVTANSNYTNYNNRYSGATGWEDEFYGLGQDHYSGGTSHRRENVKKVYGKDNVTNMAKAAAKVDLDLLTEAEWLRATTQLAPTEKCVNEKELFENYGRQLDLLKIDFDVDILEFQTEVDISTDVAEKYALHLIAETPVMFGLNYGQGNNLKSLMGDGTWVEPPSAILSSIKHEFNKVFIRDLMRHVDDKSYPVMPDYVWSLIEDDRNTAEHILEYTSWQDMALAITFGIEFDDTNSLFDEEKPKKEELFRPALMEEDAPTEETGEEAIESPLACTTCVQKRRLKVTEHGVLHHICNRCGSVVITAQNHELKKVN